MNGQTYKYLLGVPKDGEFKKTVFLVCFHALLLLWFDVGELELFY